MDSGYSGTPQLKKLGIAPGTRLDVIGAADEWRFEVEPPGVELLAEGAVDVVPAFAPTAADVARLVPMLGERVRPAGSLWIAWPRKATGHASNVTENLIRDVALPLGLVDVKVAALDADWSALKLVWRKELR
jgi:hypothetical protein